MGVGKIASQLTDSSGLFVAVGHRGLRMSLPVGITWSHAHTGKEGEIYRAVTYGNGQFVAVGSYGGANIFASTADGVTWETGTKEARYVNYLRGIGFGKDAFLGLGGDPCSVGDSKPFVMTSDDGRSWSEPVPVVVTQALLPASPEPQPAPPNAKPLASSKNMLRRFAYGNDRFVAVGQGATYLSPDGLKWEQTPNANAPLIAVFGGGVFVGSNWRRRILRSTDAIDWKNVFLADEHVEAIAFGRVAAGSS